MGGWHGATATMWACKLRLSRGLQHFKGNTEYYKIWQIVVAEQSINTHLLMGFVNYLVIDVGRCIKVGSWEWQVPDAGRVPR